MPSDGDPTFPGEGRAVGHCGVGGGMGRVCWEASRVKLTRVPEEYGRNIRYGEEALLLNNAQLKEYFIIVLF